MGTFGVIIIVVALVAALAAILSYRGAGDVYQSIGKGQFALDTEDRLPAPKAGTPAALAEQQEEVRQLVQAKSDRRVARGEPPLDVEAEVAALLRPSPAADDPELREEVRQLVVARNERRARRGEGPLDVETEVDRQLRDLGA